MQKRYLSNREKMSQLVDCGYRYIHASRARKTDRNEDDRFNGTMMRRWFCDRRGCSAWILERLYHEDEGRENTIELKAQHNHPPYRESRKLDYPYPYVPGKDNRTYEELKRMCDCRRGNRPACIDPTLELIEEEQEIFEQGYEDYRKKLEKLREDYWKDTVKVFKEPDLRIKNEEDSIVENGDSGTS